MTTKAINGRPGLQHVQSSQALVPSSREKMVSLLVEARLLQAPANGSQLLPHLKKDRSQASATIELLTEVFGEGGKLPVDLRRLVGSYIPDEEIGLLSLYVNLPRVIDLTDVLVLKRYLAPETDSGHLSCAAKIARTVYESTQRKISQNKYGTSFPMNPEILAYALQLAKHETVLEIAGATGENSAVLAFSEAERVYLNDISQKEITEFEEIRRSLPKDVRQKLESIPGDCFDLLKVKPELTKKVGLILCRNLIHFFNNEQQAKFFALLKAIMKPGARAIFTLNSTYFDPENRKVFEAHPDASSFSYVLGLICDYRRGTTPIARFYCETSPCSDDQVSTDFVSRYLYTREEGSAWKVDNNEFNKLGKELKPKIQEAFAPYKVELKRVPAGSVKVLMTSVRTYNTRTITALFKSHGFQVEQTFVTSFNGHLVHDEDLFNLPGSTPHPQKPQLVGVIVRFPG